MTTKPQLQRLVIAHPIPQQSSVLLLLPDELLLKIVLYCGLHHAPRLVATCKVANLFIDEQLMTHLFKQELAARSAIEQKKLESRRTEELKQRAVRYNDPAYLDQCYYTAFNETIATIELRSDLSYSAKSRSNLLQLIAEHDADKVLSHVIQVCSAQLLVPALLREYGEELTRVKSRFAPSRVGHVTLKTLSQHSQLIGQLLIGQSKATEILPRVQPATLLTALLNEKKFQFTPRDWLELCCLKTQESLFDTLLTRSPQLARDTPFVALLLNQQSGTRPSSAATAIVESAVKHGADVNARLPENVPLRFKPGVAVHSPLAIANFGYKGSTRIALVEWLLKHGARFSAEEVQRLTATVVSAETRALLALNNNYVPFAKKGVLQGKKQYKFGNAITTLLLDTKSFSYSVHTPGSRERTEYSGTWQCNKSSAQITLSATTQQKYTPHSSLNQSSTHTKSCALTFKYHLYATCDDKLFMLSSGISTALLKLEQMYELLLQE